MSRFIEKNSIKVYKEIINFYFSIKETLEMVIIYSSITNVEFYNYNT